MSSAKRTEAQNALLQLREKLHLTQQQVAQMLGVATVSVCRWETVRSPTGISLQRLALFARESGAPKEAAVLQEALNAEQRSYFKLPLPPDEWALQRLHMALSRAEQAYLTANLADWNEAEGHLRRLRQLQAAYVTALRALRGAYSVLVLLDEEANERDRMAWIARRESLERLIENEQKKDWTQR